MQAPKIIAFYLVATILLWIRCIFTAGALQGTLKAGTISSLYFLGLFSSITVYRLFFHRLSRFPGPFAAKITKLYGPWLSRNGKMHIEHIKLFEKYGDIVRIGKHMAATDHKETALTY